MKLIALISSFMMISAFAQAADSTPAPSASPAPTAPATYLAKGGALLYCNNSPDTWFVDGKGNQRQLVITLDFSDGSVDITITPPYSVSAPAIDSNATCFTITKQ